MVANVPTAVRKNRYVILPIDFEEAWKVRGATGRRLEFPQCERGARFQNHPYKMSAALRLLTFSTEHRQEVRRQARIL